MKDKLLYSTRELFDSYLRGKKFAIPPYQRGYKWERKDIVRLLDDVNSFNSDNELDLFYCLQNITLVENREYFNVVDGQQRLTTLAVILSYLGEYQLIAGRLQYNIREETEAFLSEYIYKSSLIREINSWEQLLEIASAAGKDYDFQDIYYLFSAYKAVQQWFEMRNFPTSEMKAKILDCVKVIVNLPRNIDEQELFENLNGKRVPLDGADLIRALIITRVAKKEFGEFGDSIKQNVLINERRVRIGSMLDAINLWWTDENKKTYFRQFSKEVSVGDSNSVAFDNASYPINFLYKLYALAYNNGEMSIELFEKKSTEDGFLQELQMLQRTIENWYNDTELYHLTLFSMIYAADGNKEKRIDRLSFKKLYEIWQTKNRRAFIKYLKDRIAQTDTFDELMKQVDISDKANEETALKESWYDQKLVAVATLLDIIHLLALNGSDRLPAPYFRAHKEDLEHIFPQTPIGDKIKDKSKQTQILYEYIEIINNYLPAESHISVSPEEINWNDKEWKESIKNLINNTVKKVIPIDSLGNMCVLHESVNRGFGNDFFLEKRIDIMRKSQEGYFIRPHVYEAFNKIFYQRQNDSINMKMMTRWDKGDILARRKDIISKIFTFLNS